MRERKRNRERKKNRDRKKNRERKKNKEKTPKYALSRPKMSKIFFRVARQLTKSMQQTNKN